jgi:hypothetical protein
MRAASRDCAIDRRLPMSAKIIACDALEIVIHRTLMWGQCVEKKNEREMRDEGIRGAAEIGNMTHAVGILVLKSFSAARFVTVVR